MESATKFITSPDITEATAMAMINDTYLELSSISGTRKQRGEKQSARTHVEGPKQHMPIGMKWQEFLSVGENKEQLISLLGTYFENLSNNNLLSMPLIFTTGDKTLHLENGEETIIKSCSHEEADTRLVLHAIEQESDVVVVCKDTDVLMLLVWAYSSYKVTHNWYFKYEGEKYACIRTIVDSWGQLFVRFFLPSTQ